MITSPPGRAEVLAFGLLLAAALAVSGCSSDDGDEAAPPVSSAAPPPSTGGPPPPADGSDVSACFDAICEVAVSGTVDVPLDPRFGFTRFTIGVIPGDRTTFEGEDPVGGNLHAWLGSDGELTVANGFTIDVLRVEPTGVVLRFSPTT